MIERSKRFLSLWDLMRAFNAGLFLRHLRALQGMSSGALVTSITAENQRSMAKMFAPFEKDCRDLGLAATAISLHRLINKLSAASEKPSSLKYSGDRELEAIVNEVTGRLTDESEARLFFSLTAPEADYYNWWPKGWEEILDRFPAALDDVEESSKCFALSRYAAAVFHSTQVVEVGLIELGTFIGVADPKSGWSAVVSKLKGILAKPYADLTQFDRENRESLEQILGTVEALKNAWRNKISHAHGKLLLMTKDYSSEVAEEILFATRAFMRRLATDLPPPRDKLKQEG